MYLHAVITEKATSSFTNGANHQNDEGIRDEGRLFITNVLQKALNVNSNIKKSYKEKQHISPPSDVKSPNAVSKYQMQKELRGALFFLSSFNDIVHTLNYAPLGKNSTQGVKGINRGVLPYHRTGIEDTTAAYICVITKNCAYLTKTGLILLISVYNYGLSVALKI